MLDSSSSHSSSQVTENKLMKLDDLLRVLAGKSERIRNMFFWTTACSWLYSEKNARREEHDR